MFGYVIANLEGLTQAQKDRYKGCYCGLCRVLKQRHGFSGRLTLTYDMTFLVLVLTIWARARGKSTVCAFKRTIPDEQTQNAMIIAFIVLALAVFGGIFISATSPMGFTDAVYEAVSALATVGLSAGGTASLSIPAQILIIIYMYFGRVGVLTISLGFLAGNRAEERFRYAETNLLIG